MRRLAIIVIVLLAVFTLINAYTGDAGGRPAQAVDSPIEDAPVID